MNLENNKEVLETIQKKIPGVDIRAFKQSDALISCKFTLTFSDVKNLFDETPSGLPKNRKLQKDFFNLLKTHLQRVAAQKEVKNA